MCSWGSKWDAVKGRMKMNGKWLSAVFWIRGFISKGQQGSDCHLMAMSTCYKYSCSGPPHVLIAHHTGGSCTCKIQGILAITQNSNSSCLVQNHSKFRRIASLSRSVAMHSKPEAELEISIGLYAWKTRTPCGLLDKHTSI